MFGWAEIALLLLRVANSIVTWAREQTLLTAGQDQAIAKASTDILRKTQAGKKIMERIDAMPDSGLNDLVDDLGGKG